MKYANEPFVPSGISTNSGSGFGEALMRRARRAKVYYVTLGLFALFSASAVSAGLLSSDIIVTIGIFFILALGLELLYGMVGLLNFGHIGFFTISAYTSAILNARFGVDIWLSSAAGIVLALLIAMLLGRIVLRLSSTYFIFGTLAFGLMVHSFVVVAYPLTGGGASLGGIQRPSLGGVVLSSDLAFGALVWILAATAFWYSLSLKDSRTGRAMKAVRSDADAARSLGVDVERIRMNALLFSVFLAALAGVLFASYYGSVHPDSFDIGVLIDVILMVFLGGAGSIWGTLVGAAIIVLLPELNSMLRDASDLINGILFAVVLLAFPSGIAGLAQRFGKARSVHDGPPSERVNSAVPSSLLKAFSREMEIEGLSKQFGGVKAVDDVSFILRAGRIRGLIGPNGAGKSTTINLITGFLTPNSGTVQSGDIELTGLRPDRIAREFNVIRTFQHERLFCGLNVIENVMVGQQRGAEGTLRETLVSLFGIRSWAKQEEAAMRESLVWLALLDLANLAHADVGTLPNGTRKLIEVARACAAGPTVLLLDETAAGLNGTERVKFGDFVRRLRDAGITILMIEHDLELVMGLSDDICVLDFGRQIADGTPQEVRANPAVVSAYLGS